MPHAPNEQPDPGAAPSAPEACKRRRLTAASGGRSVRRVAIAAAASLLAANLAIARGGLDPGAFDLLDLDGTYVALAGLVGDDVPTVLLFWSLYQPGSRQAIRALDELVRCGEVTVRAIAVEIPEYREGPEAIAEFTRRAGVALPIFVDPEGFLRDAAAEVAGGGRTLPATYLLDAGGSLELIATRWIEGYAERVRERLERPGAEDEAR